MNIFLSFAPIQVLINFLGFNGFAYIFTVSRPVHLDPGDASHWSHMPQLFPLFLESLVMLRTIIRLEWLGRGNIYNISTNTILLLWSIPTYIILHTKLSRALQTDKNNCSYSKNAIRIVTLRKYNTHSIPPPPPIYFKSNFTFLKSCPQTKIHACHLSLLF